MDEREQHLQQFKEQFLKALEQAATEGDLEQLRLIYLSRHGLLAGLMDQLKSMQLEEKKIYGPAYNKLKQELMSVFEEKKREIIQAKITQEQERLINFDVTAYYERPQGSLHPLTLVVEALEDVFMAMGFAIADGPEVETPFFNFEALNIPEHHPARELQDTFWLKTTPFLLRTHTSSVQIHALLEQKPPVALAAPGRVYRSEATDATHDFMFMQCEGLFVDKDVSMGNLIATLKVFLRKVLERENLRIRVRPSYFPFVEPGIEVDISCLFCKHGCSICKKTNWIELGGAGLVHPHVLRSCNIDPTVYNGFAFGFGIERIAMLKYGINDIRLFRSNKVEFLKQF
ncbi:MAG TPA: phenylalanine--tRNA ligase subunit alpha [Candidatus Babeliaceae bacterium]|nr:phenylalanine--tRNA ligase subunit alpha [Candidatus Babeliaceae bacterium]